MPTVSVKNSLFLLGFIALLGPMSMGIYLPAFPHISKEWHLHGEELTLTMSSFMMGTAIGQLFYGPIIDRFGAFKPLVIGLGIYFISLLICYYSQNINSLIIGRFIMALGACSGGISTRVTVRLTFPKDKIASAFSTLTLIIGISPIFSPILGNIIIEHYGWRAVFIFLAVLAILISLAVFLFFPKLEGNSKEKLNATNLIQDYKTILADKPFVFYSFILAFSSASVMIYASASSFIFIDYFHLPREQYVYYYSMVGTGLIVGSMLNKLSLKKFKSDVLIIYGLVLQIIVGVIFLFSTLEFSIPVGYAVLMFFLYFSLQGLVTPNAAALALDTFSNEVGVASSLNLSISMVINSLGTFLLSQLGVGSLTMIIGIMLTFTCVAIGLNLIYRHRVAKNISHPQKDVYLLIGETK